MQNYRKLVNEIRKKSFPEIKGHIIILEIPFAIPGAAIFYIFPRLKLMVFTNKCKELSKNPLTGLIAHELSHFSRFDKKGYWYYWKYFLFVYGEKARKEEKETDKLTIRKGYGKEMIATKRKAEKLLKGTKWEKYLDNYLTEKEVLNYYNKIKKNSSPNKS